MNYPGHVLKQGAREPAVQEVQRFINRLGVKFPRHYKALAVDGQYGVETARQVRAFQKRHHIVVDGQVGPQTWAAFFGNSTVPAHRHHKVPTGSRAACIVYAKHFVGVTEHPYGSNSGPEVTAWERHTARGASYLDHAPWCGIFAENMLSHVGVNTTPRMASVSMIEDDARASRYCYRGWHDGANFAGVERGDLVVLFGRGVHVEIIRYVDHRRGIVYTIGGNTSNGTAGSQSNGGMVALRARSFSEVHGVALINFPG